jgi:hypothetical protein
MWASAGRTKLAWVFLEILAALAVAVAIVWWTLPRKRDEPTKDLPASGEKKDGDGR